MCKVWEEHKKNTKEKSIDSVDSNDPFYSKSNMNHLCRGVAAINAGKGKEHDILEG